jgi:predicted phosphoribosyltransferase
MKYDDRTQAGKVLAENFRGLTNHKDILVLALPRGGVPVAYEIAKTLNAPLDVFIVRKLGVPTHEELAMGALATGGVTVFNEEIVRQLHIPKEMMDEVIEKEKVELARREAAYRGNKPLPEIKNKTIILVDDGIATGATMRAAVKALRLLKPAKIIIAIPVAEYNTCQEMEKIADEVICPLKPTMFYAVGAWYENFPQTTDEEVCELLKR